MVVRKQIQPRKSQARLETEGRMIYKLREPGGEFFSMLRSSNGAIKPVFNAGKEFGKYHEVIDALTNYELYSEGKWPKLELFTYQVHRVEENAPVLPETEHLIRFIRRTRLKSRAMLKFLTRLNDKGVKPRFLLMAMGVHDIDGITPVKLHRDQAARFYHKSKTGGWRGDLAGSGQTIVAFDSETDLIFLRLAIGTDKLLGIWDYQSNKQLYMHSMKLEDY